MSEGNNKLTPEEEKLAEKEILNSSVGDENIYTQEEVDGVMETYFEEVAFPTSSAGFDDMMESLGEMSIDATEKRGERALMGKFTKAQYKIKPFDDSEQAKKEADFVKQQYGLHSSDILSNSMSSIINGFSVWYPKFIANSGSIEWKSIENLGAENYQFASNDAANMFWELQNSNELILKLNEEDSFRIDQETNLELDPALKRRFLVYSFDQYENNRYGRSLRYINYFYWKMWKSALRTWHLYGKKATIPSVVAFTDGANTSTENKEKSGTTATDLKKVGNGSSIVLYNVKDLKLLQASAGGHVSLRELYNELKRLRLQTYLGTTIGLEESATGNSFNIAEFADNVSNHYALQLLSDASRFINEVLFKQLVDFNRKGNNDFGYPSIEYFFPEKADIKNVLEAGKNGAPLKKSALINDYHLPIATDEDMKDDDVIYLNNPSSSASNEGEDANALNHNEYIKSYNTSNEKKKTQ